VSVIMILLSDKINRVSNQNFSDCVMLSNYAIVRCDEEFALGPYRTRKVECIFCLESKSL
jgi:hypothetical protein